VKEISNQSIMSKFGTKGKASIGEAGPSKVVKPGDHYMKITKMEVTTSRQKGTPGVKITLETAPVKDPSFQGYEGAQGQLAWLQTIWLKTDDQISEFQSRIATIADKLGLREQVDKIEANDLSSYITQVEALLKGNYAWWCIGGEERMKEGTDGSSRVVTDLFLTRYGFIRSGDEYDPNKPMFDKGNKYHFKPLGAAAPAASQEALNDQLNSVETEETWETATDPAAEEGPF
jgi:hypothetical protein